MPSKQFPKLEPHTRWITVLLEVLRGNLGSRTLRKANCAAETLLVWMGREILSSCSELGEGAESRNGETEEPGLQERERKRNWRWCLFQAILGKIDRKAGVSLPDIGDPLSAAGARQAGKGKQAGNLSLCPGGVTDPVLGIPTLSPFAGNFTGRKTGLVSNQNLPFCKGN